MYAKGNNLMADFCLFDEACSERLIPGMEISLLKPLLNSITCLLQLSCESIDSEPVQKYHSKTREILKLLKPILDAITDAETVSDELFQRPFTGLLQSVNESREICENWQPLMSKVYFVLQVESIISRIRTHGVESLELLASSDQFLPAEISAADVENLVRKITNAKPEQDSLIIMNAIRDHVENSRASSDDLAKVADILGFMSNQELLIEVVALEKLKENTEQAENPDEVEYLDQMIAMVTHMHDILVTTKQSKICRGSQSVEMGLELVEVENKVKGLVEDLKNGTLDTQRKATYEIRLLAKHMDNRIVIANCNAIIVLVNLLRSPDSTVQENTATALLNLSINDNNKSAIVNAGGIKPLIHVLEIGSHEAKENSAATLFSLSAIKENKMKIGQSGAIKPLVELMGNGTPRGKKDSAATLFNLSINHKNKSRIVQAGAVKYLVELMDPAFGMVDNAVTVLSNLATIHEGRDAIGEEGGIPVLVEVVELGSGRGKENAAAALLQLCTNKSKFCKMVLLEGVVPPLVALSQSGTPRAREKAQQLLDYFRNQSLNE